jgi:GST-like protein
MLYLAEKHGQFIPSDPTLKWKTTEWLMWQMGGLGPMAGQAHHFLKYNVGKAPYAEDRYRNEAKRLYGVLDKQLSDKAYIANEYSIADMAVWPWVSRFEWQEINLSDFSNVMRWYKEIASRDAVQKGYHVPKFVNDIPMP